MAKPAAPLRSRLAGSCLASLALLALAAFSVGSSLGAFVLPSGAAARAATKDAAPVARVAAERSSAGAGESDAARPVAWAAVSAACAFLVGLTVAAQPARAWDRLGIQPSNITSFDDFLQKLEKQFLPLQKLLLKQEGVVEEKRAEVKAIEEAQKVLQKMEDQESAVVAEKAPVADPFVKDDLKTLKKEEKAIAIIEETVEEIKKEAKDPEEKKALDAMKKVAEKDLAVIKKDEVRAEAKAEAPKAEAPKAEAPKAEAPKAEASEAEAPEAPEAPAPKAEAPKEAKEEAKAVLKEEEKVMQKLEEKKKEALKEQMEAEAKLDQTKKDIAVEQKVEEADLKKVKDDLIKEAKVEAEQKKETVKEAAKELEQKAEKILEQVEQQVDKELQKVKQEIKAEAKPELAEFKEPKKEEPKKEEPKKEEPKKEEPKKEGPKKEEALKEEAKKEEAKKEEPKKEEPKKEEPKKEIEKVEKKAEKVLEEIKGDFAKMVS